MSSDPLDDFLNTGGLDDLVQMFAPKSIFRCPQCPAEVDFGNNSTATCPACGARLQRPSPSRSRRARRPSINYEVIKKAAKEQKCRVTDLIVLAQQHDPFYVGAPAPRAAAAWFGRLWEEFGYTSGVHLRRIHYQLISQRTPVRMPNGEPYENTEKCWSYLTSASQAARYLGLVDPTAFVDRRNPAPLIFAEEVICAPELAVSSDLSEIGLQLPDFPNQPAYSLEGFERGQAYHLELWCEKSTMNDVLVPVCQQYGANLITGLGEMSITAALGVVQRVQERRKPARIFYVSDFDPAGNGMPVSISRKVEFYASMLEGTNCQLFPIVLTAEQVEEYELPRTPIKDGEKRRGAFEERYGEGATELDALQALHPGTLAEIISEAFAHYFDDDLAAEVEEARERFEAETVAKQEEVYARHTEEVEALRAEYTAIRAEFEGRMASHNARLSVVWKQIAEELAEEAPEVGAVDVPKPSAGRAFGEPLYDSRRNYNEQLKAYKVFQGKW